MRKCHRWTDAERRHVAEILTELEPLNKYIASQYLNPCPSKDIWNRVAAALYIRHGITVTGSACKRQYELDSRTREVREINKRLADMDTERAKLIARVKALEC